MLLLKYDVTLMIAILSVYTPLVSYTSFSYPCERLAMSVGYPKPTFFQFFSSANPNYIKFGILKKLGL